MFITQKAAFAALLLVLIPFSTMGMEQPNFAIYGQNIMSGWFPRRVIASWTNQEDTDSLVLVPADKPELLCFYKELADGSKINFAAYGKVTGLSAASLNFTKEELLQKFNELKKDTEDGLLLTIDIATSQVSFIPNFKRATKAEQLEWLRISENDPNILATFGNLSHYPNILALVNEDRILRFKNAHDIAIPASYIQNATTAEDVYRYILGLKSPFTKTELDSKFKKLSRKYHPDRYPGDKNYAAKVFRIIRKAYKDLEKFLEEKELGGEWTDLQPAWQPDSPRTQPKAQESSERAVVVAAEEEL